MFTASFLRSAFSCPGNLKQTCVQILLKIYSSLFKSSLEVISPTANLWSLEILKWQNLHTVPQAGGDTGHDG